jgi:hypothetical protein
LANGYTTNGWTTWYKLPDDALIAPYFNPQNINLIVVGGETNTFWQTTDFTYTAIALIDAWR